MCSTNHTPSTTSNCTSPTVISPCTTIEDNNSDDKLHQSKNTICTLEHCIQQLESQVNELHTEIVTTQATTTDTVDAYVYSAS